MPLPLQCRLHASLMYVRFSHRYNAFRFSFLCALDASPLQSSNKPPSAAMVSGTTAMLDQLTHTLNSQKPSLSADNGVEHCWACTYVPHLWHLCTPPGKSPFKHAGQRTIEGSGDSASCTGDGSGITAGESSEVLPRLIASSGWFWAALIIYVRPLRYRKWISAATSALKLLRLSKTWCFSFRNSFPDPLDMAGFLPKPNRSIQLFPHNGNRAISPIIFLAKAMAKNAFSWSPYSIQAVDNIFFSIFAA